MTTVITSAVLYWLGTEEVKGFGITLLIGLISSLFTALFRDQDDLRHPDRAVRRDRSASLPLTFPKWDRMLQPKIDWMSKVPILLRRSQRDHHRLGLMAFVHYANKGEIAGHRVRQRHERAV